MSQGNKALWWVLGLVVVVGVAWAFATQKPATVPTTKVSGPVKLGGLVPLTGDGAAYGTPIQRAAILAVEEINAAGGVQGQQLEVVWEDGKCEGKESATAAQKLVNVDGVKAILGGVCSSETLAAAPITEAAQVLILSPSSTSPDLTGAGDFVFRTSPSDALAGQVAADYAYTKLNLKKAAIISEQKDYTQGLRRVFKERWTALGGTIVADEVFNTGDTDFRTQILKIKNVAPDVVYLLPQTVAPGGVLLKQIKDNGLVAQLLGAELMTAPGFVSEYGKLAEGFIGVEQFFDPKSEKAAALFTKYKERYNEEPPFPGYMANMYSQVYLLKEGIEQVGLDTTNLRDWLYEVKGWQHALGSLTFDKNGDPLSQFSVRKVSKGALVDVEVYTPGQ